PFEVNVLKGVGDLLTAVDGKLDGFLARRFADLDGSGGGIDRVNGWEVELGSVVDLVGWSALLVDDESKVMMIMARGEKGSKVIEGSGNEKHELLHDEIHGGWMDAG
ncbi:unnamed protein product, partial [Prunus brigantina]